MTSRERRFRFLSRRRVLITCSWLVIAVLLPLYSTTRLFRRITIHLHGVTKEQPSLEEHVYDRSDYTPPLSSSSRVVAEHHCGCPMTCDASALNRRMNGLPFSCGERIQYLMITYGDSHSKACSAAVQGKACGVECDPRHCIMLDTEQVTTDYEPYDPHLGARYANGSLGLIVNPSPARLPALNTSKTHDCEVGIEGHGGRQVLDKVRAGVIASKQKTTKSSPRILCMVYTYEHNHETIRAISRTWARQCDGFFAASNMTDDSIGAIDLLHHGPEEYGNMWQKVRSMWAYAYDHFRDTYDYFYICGDDTYLVVDNLRSYLVGDEVQNLLNGHLDVFAKLNPNATQWKTKRPRPLLLGLPVRYHRNMVFPLGGGGYVLNRAALDWLVEVGLKEFLPGATDSREDVFIGSAFWAHGVTTADSRDETGAFRFGGTAEKLYHFDGTRSPIAPFMMKRTYGTERLKGLDGVSSETVAFHLQDKGSNITEMIARFDAILQGHCEN